MANENKKAVTKEELPSILEELGVIFVTIYEPLNSSTISQKTGSLRVEYRIKKIILTLDIEIAIIYDRALNSNMLTNGFRVIFNKNYPNIKTLENITVNGSGNYEIDIYTGTTSGNTSSAWQDSGEDTQNATLSITDNELTFTLNHTKIQEGAAESIPSGTKYVYNSTANFHYTWEILLT